MDVSAEAADVVVRESLQATEAAAKLTLEGVKNVAALLLAIAKQDMKGPDDRRPSPLGSAVHLASHKRGM